jgi:hypothetical protein
MRYVIDIDGTICTQSDGEYTDSQPLVERINIINKLYEEGHTIIFQTARGMGRYDNDAKKAIEKFYDFTEKQLASWNVQYHKLVLGKAAGDFYVDDKSLPIEQFFNKES